MRRNNPVKRGATRGRTTATRGRGAFRGRGNVTKKYNKNRLQKPYTDKEEIILDLNINENATEYFTSNATFDQHHDAQTENKEKYLATMMALNEYSIEMQANAKSRSLAAAFARRDKPLVDYLLNNEKQIGFVDLLKSLQILDSTREIKSIQKKIATNAELKSVMKSHKLGKLKSDIHNLERLKPKIGSVSGALARKIRTYVRKFKESELEFFALHMPTAPWKTLANLVHLNPEKDFPNASWFLPYCFGKELPVDSKVLKCKNLTKENVNQIVEEFDLPYTVLKPFKDSLTDKSKEKIALNQEKLDTIIWYYEELACPAVDNIIRNRLEKGDKIELGYGKLMERLLMFKDLQDKNRFSRATSVSSVDSWVDTRSLDSWDIITNDNSLFGLIAPIAEFRLKNFKSSLSAPVAVLGDASGSMSVAIRTATIISSLLAAICSAKLSFFNTENFDAKLDPSSIADVLKVAYSTKADGGTAPAASLCPYYNKKEIVKTFVIVTDEEENANATTEDKKSWKFFELFMEYRKLVYPASLIFVSFLGHQHNEGQMYREFKRENVSDVLQFKFDRSRPDLSKLDSILGSLCSKDSQSFNGYVEQIESRLKTSSIAEIIQNLKIVSSPLSTEESIDEVLV